MLRLAALLTTLALPACAEDAVGRLNLAGYKTREMCSATLIAPDLALTAAHCVTRPEDGYLKRLGDMVFVAGWDGAGHAGAARVASVEVHPEAYAEGNFDLRHDVALIRLTEPLDVPPLDLGSAAPPGPLEVLGYPRSTPHRLSLQTGCTGTLPRALWRIDCLVEKGQSGGPVIAGDGAARRIVAVIVGVTKTQTLAVPVDGWLRRKAALR